jgi:hypothetical protein
MQVLFVDTPEGAQIGPERGARSLAAVAMDLALPITIVIPRPFAYTMADHGMGWMTAPVALPFVGVQPRADSRNVFLDEATASPSVRVVAYPQALLARIARNDADDGRPIVGIGAVASPLIGPPPGRISGVGMGRALFPPRSGTVRRPQTSCRSSHQRVRCDAGSSARAGATCAVACAISPARGLGARWVRPSQCRAAAGPV